MARGKSITHFCSHCERDAKMEMIGPVEDRPEKSWYRCTRCRHATLIDLGALKQRQEDSKKKLERADALEYKPENTYKVGQAIFHVEWDDIGKVTSKEKTSNGHSAIVVAFEKLGERRLLENLVITNE